MTQGHRSPAGIVDDPLVSLLSAACRQHNDDLNYETEPDIDDYSASLIAAMGAEADWLRAGLAWRGLRDAVPNDWVITARADGDVHFAWTGAINSIDNVFGRGPTLLSALTDLLAKLEARP